jgi:hypothetical protein
VIVAVVAVGMWKPAFGAGFQAPWDERQLSVRFCRGAHGALFPQRTKAILPISCKCRRRNMLKTKILVFRKPRNMHSFPDSCSEPFRVYALAPRDAIVMVDPGKVEKEVE